MANEIGQNRDLDFFYLAIARSNSEQVRNAWAKKKMAFPFSPEEISDEAQANWNTEDVMGRSEPWAVYGSTGQRQLSLTVELYASYDAKAEVVDKANWLRATQYPVYEGDRMYPPPTLIFVYGDLIKARVICLGAPVTWKGPWTLPYGQTNPTVDNHGVPVAGQGETSKYLPMAASISLSLGVVSLEPMSASTILNSGGATTDTGG